VVSRLAWSSQADNRCCSINDGERDVQLYDQRSAIVVPAMLHSFRVSLSPTVCLVSLPSERRDVSSTLLGVRRGSDTVQLARILQAGDGCFSINVGVLDTALFHSHKASLVAINVAWVAQEKTR